MEKIFAIILYLGVNIISPTDSGSVKEYNEDNSIPRDEIIIEENLDILDTEKETIIYDEDDTYKEYMEYKSNNKFVKANDIIEIKKGNKFNVELKDDVTDNYEWVFIIEDENLIELTDDLVFELSAKNKDISFNQRIFEFKALKNGSTKIKFIYYKVPEKKVDEKPVKEKVNNEYSYNYNYDTENESEEIIIDDYEEIVVEDFDYSIYNFNMGNANVDFFEDIDGIEIEPKWLFPNTYEKRIQEYELYKKGSNFINKNQQETIIKIGESVSIELDEFPRDGFQWFYKIDDYTILKVIDDRFFYLGEDKLMIEGEGRKVLKFKGLKEGEVEILLKYYYYDIETDVEKIEKQIKIKIKVIK